MRIARLRIQNFRCFIDETISFDAYTCLVGPGGSGKSTTLTALRIFFRDTAGSPTDLLCLQREDFHECSTEKAVTITITFTDLEPEAQAEFAHYFRQGQLVISAVASWNEQAGTAEVKQFGERMAFAPFRPFFEAVGSGENVAALRSIYSGLLEKYPELPKANSKQAMQDALSSYEAAHAAECELTRSEDQFYGITRGSTRLQKFVQWVFVPAVKDASTEQLEAKRTALSMLLDRTVRAKLTFSDRLSGMRAAISAEYQRLLDANKPALESLSQSLTSRLKEWAHPEAQLSLTWRNDPKYVSITEPQAEVLAGEGKFVGSISRLGHGLQRSFLLALLQELSGCGDTGNPRLILACEEPELYQHPPQARYLSSVLQKLSTLNSQVVVSTHSPYFISGRGFEDVRLLRRDWSSGQPTCNSVDFKTLSGKLAEAFGEEVPIPNLMEFKVEQALQPVLNEMFFAPVLVLVEGIEDMAYASAYMTLSNRTDEFRRLGCHIVPTSGKGNLPQALAIARQLDIPTFVIFDADGHQTDKPDNKAKHERDNVAILRLCSLPTADPFPKAVFWTDSLVIWPTTLASSVEEEIGSSEWDRYETAVKKKRGIIGVGRLEKNCVYIGLVLAEMFAEGKRSAILEKLCEQMLSFARAASSRSTVDAGAAGASAD